MTRNQARKIWKRTLKQQRADGLNIKFIHYKKALKRSGIAREINAVLKVLRPDAVDSFFRSRYMTVVVPKRWWQFWKNTTTWIITPVKIGSEGRPKRQVAILAHELQHGIDFEGDVRKVLMYITDDAYRIYIEVDGELAESDIAGPRNPQDIFDERWQDVYCLSARQANYAQRRYSNLEKNERYNSDHATKAGDIVSRVEREVCG